MKKINKLLIFFLLISFSLFTFQSCSLFNGNPDMDNLGWIGNEEDTEHIEDDISFGDFGDGDLPASVDLLNYFPSIGNQGSYGTCVAWACGYNFRTFLDAKSGNYTSFSDANTFSAKDLFWAIENADKGADCNGTGFEHAFDVMVSRGIATQSVVPYDNLGDCSSSPESGWTTNANEHKISSYREIEVDVNTIKTYLAQGRAVVFGAKLGDEFMDCNSDEVLDFQTYGYTGPHAYHAMILGGYDDSKGPNGAFKVVNSWGTSWGDNGYIWVDQNFFCTDDFCFCAFVGTNTQEDPDGDGDGQTDDPNSGLDLMAWELNDIDYYDEDDPDSEDPRWRTSIYNVYNSGEEAINASEDWYIIYFLYNAYDGDDYTIILVDYYSDDFGDAANMNDPELNNGEIPEGSRPDIPANGYWWNHVNIASGQSVSDAVFGGDDPFHWTYKMPEVTGDYYLVIYADGFDQFSEFDESNNWTYFAHENGDPIHIVNGVMDNPPTKKIVAKNGRVPQKGEAADYESVRSETNVNAYSTQEIGRMLTAHRESGELQKRTKAFLENGTKPKRKY